MKLKYPHYHRLFRWQIYQFFLVPRISGLSLYCNNRLFVLSKFICAELEQSDRHSVSDSARICSLLYSIFQGLVRKRSWADETNIRPAVTVDKLEFINLPIASPVRRNCFLLNKTQKTHTKIFFLSRHSYKTHTCKLYTLNWIKNIFQHTPLWSLTMSNALLLRLFTSEFFNSWIAVSYLFRYPDNVGIQHYLCNELKSFPLSEIEFFLPQLV